MLGGPFVDPAGQAELVAAHATVMGRGVVPQSGRIVREPAPEAAGAAVPRTAKLGVGDAFDEGFARRHGGGGGGLLSVV